MCAIIVWGMWWRAISAPGGFAVLHPMGWDAFGLPAENAALERNIHPAKWTYENIDHMRQQLKALGLSLDWDREITTCAPEYYRHEQKFFLDFFKAGLAYRKKALVNWDPVENTVLANEQVIDGRGWRSGVAVEKRQLNQWFLKITDYAEDLLDGLDILENWPDKVRFMQQNWINRSEGAHVTFQLDGAPDTLDVFTTRPDTLFGAAFCALAFDHPLTQKMAADNPALRAFIADNSKADTSEETLEKEEKIGFDTGIEVVHPFDKNRKLPLFVANFVLMGYGTGAIFGCPAHDARDLEFARKYHLTVTPVVHPPNVKPADFIIADDAFTGDGVVFNSDFLNGLDVTEAKQQAIARLEALGLGKATVTYRLRDWGYHASVIGAVPSLLSIAIPVAWCQFQKPTCPLPCQRMLTLASRVIPLTITPHGNTANAQFVASPPSVKPIH